MPSVAPAKTSKMWWRYNSKRDTLTLIAHANSGGQNNTDTGSKAVQNISIKKARDAWPDGKLK